MKAVRFYKNHKEFFIENVEKPTIRNPDEVLVQVKACGICGSDLHLLHGFIKPAFSPIIPGHESSGIIAEVGKNVKKVKPGDHVVISAGISCGKCFFCKNHRENLCEEVGVLGFHCNGAMAEYICVEERNVFKISSHIPFSEAAILADAVSTPFYAIKKIGNFQKDQKIAVLGCGGLGIHAIKIARALEASEIYAFDISDTSLQNARNVGANHTFLSYSIREIVKSLHKKIYFHLILDFTGIYDFVEPMLRLLFSGGKYIIVGLSKGQLQIRIPSIITFRSLSICGSYGIDSETFQELIDFYNIGKISLNESISGKFPLDKINDCVRELENRKNSIIRFILTP